MTRLRTIMNGHDLASTAEWLENASTAEAKQMLEFAAAHPQMYSKNEIELYRAAAKPGGLAAYKRKMSKKGKGQKRTPPKQISPKSAAERARAIVGDTARASDKPHRGKHVDPTAAVAASKRHSEESAAKRASYVAHGIYKYHKDEVLASRREKRTPRD